MIGARTRLPQRCGGGPPLLAAPPAARRVAERAAAHNGASLRLPARRASPRIVPAAAGGGNGASSDAKPLASQRCEPCAATAEAAAAGPLDATAARARLGQLSEGWRLVEGDPRGLRIRRRYRTKNFVKGLELFQRIGAVAEAEKHHPDLALESWNNVTVSLWTHERGGLTGNDFIVAAKIDAVDKADLLSKKPPADD